MKRPADRIISPETWRAIAPSSPGVEVDGDDGARELLAAAFGILAGRADANTLDRLLMEDPAGGQLFVNDDCWWRYTDFQCHFHALHGWRPFCGETLRRADLCTWSAGFRDQVTGETQRFLREEHGVASPPPVGWLPAQYSGDERHFACRSPAQYSCNVAPDSAGWAFEEDKAYPGYHLFSRLGEHDLNPDYPLMNCLSATDWMLWERDARAAEEYLPRIEEFLGALAGRADETGYFLFGPQGSQIEFAHGGWRRQSSTHLYFWKVLASLAEVYAMLGDRRRSASCAERAGLAAERLRRFETGDRRLVSGFSRDFSRTFGTGAAGNGSSGYLEVWPNVNAALTGWWDRGQCARLAGRFEATPPLVDNHLTLANWPARPIEEQDSDHDGFPPPGTHVNGGFFWMCAAGALALYARGGRPETLARLEELLDDHRRHFSVDCYNQWGRNKEEQFPHLPRNTHSVTCAGAAGHFFRGLLGLSVSSEMLRIFPGSLPQIDRLALLQPVRWGGKELLIEASGHGVVASASIDGGRAAAAAIDSGGGISIAFDDLPARSRVKVKLA